MLDYITNHWDTLLFGLAALIVWTIGNAIKKKILVYVGIALCVLAVLTYTNLFDFIFEL